MPDRLADRAPGWPLATRVAPGEALWLWRRDLGLNQAQVAARLGVGRGLVSAVERGLAGPRDMWRLPVVAYTTVLGLALARRRSKLGLKRVAALVGVSKPTLLAMERRGDPALTKFWAAFTFARKRR